LVMQALLRVLLLKMLDEVSKESPDLEIVADLLERCIAIVRRLEKEVRCAQIDGDGDLLHALLVDMVRFRGKKPTPNKVNKWLGNVVEIKMGVPDAPAAEEEAPTEEAALAEEEAAEPQETEEEVAARRAAEELAAAQARLKEAAELLATMRSKIAELKSYKVEPKAVGVLHACFVLLGERRKHLKDWGDVRQMLGATFFERVNGFESDKATHKLMKRVAAATTLLEPMSAEEVEKSSEALAGVRQWVSAAIDSLQGAAAVALAEQQRAAAEGSTEVQGYEGLESGAVPDGQYIAHEEEDSQDEDDALDEQAKALVDAIMQRQKRLNVTLTNLPYSGALQTGIDKVKPADA